MSRFPVLFLFALTISFSQPAAAAIHTESVDYRQGNTVLKGYLAYDDSLEGKRPGVLVVHEWWGHNDYARRRTRMLAELGYTAFALDMYGDGRTAEHPAEAGGFARAVKSRMDIAEARFQAALDVLRAHETVQPDEIAAIGYCFGGGIVLQMARRGVDLKGVASFHGTLATDALATPGSLQASVLVLHGAADPFIPFGQVEAFRQEMDAAGADYEIIEYEGVTHSFTNPGADEVARKFSLPLAYDAEADQNSWQALVAFLRDIFAD